MTIDTAQVFNFLPMPTDVHFGPGVVGTLADHVRAIGGTRILIVTDPGVRAAGLCETVASVCLLYREQCARSREIVAAADLDQEAFNHWGDPPHEVTLRWILVHLIEETARHLGHADILREQIDGATGDRAGR